MMIAGWRASRLTGTLQGGRRCPPTRLLQFYPRKAVATNRPLSTTSDSEQQLSSSAPLQAPPPPPEEDTAPGPAQSITSGANDAKYFQLHPSVAKWYAYAPRTTNVVSGGQGATQEDKSKSPQEMLLERVMTEAQTLDAESAAYWAYHAARLVFFFSQGAASLAAHHVATIGASGLLTRSSSSSSSGDSSTQTPFERVLSTGATYEMANRANEAMAAWQEDLSFIKAGVYKLPWDMTTIRHRQFNPLYMLRRTGLFLNEAVATLMRRRREVPEPLWINSPLYPEYYMQTFHFQTDGWMSARSARTYEHSTETLFSGRQDAMQRLSLVPLAQWMGGRDPRGVRLMELAAGTGRFHTFIKDNYPSMATLVSDLSPFYLSAARDNLEHWRDVRGGPAYGAAGIGTTTYVQCAAEATGQAENSLDVVLAVYLFHEIPHTARAAVAAEMFRILKPGGLAILTDSTQYGDRATLDASLAAFQSFNEPHWGGYIDTSFGKMFEDAGFKCEGKWVNSVTKTLSFIKPEL